MNLILRQVIGYQQGLKKAPASDPKLKTELEQTKKDLHSILKKWKFGEAPITSSQEFLNNFEPWINKQLEQQKELKVFLAKKGVTSLAEAETKLTNRELGEGEELASISKELADLKQELKTFLDKNSSASLAEWEQTWLNTEQEYLKKIQELQENREVPEDYEELITERDQLARAKGELEQELLSLNNKLRLKQQEVVNKEKSLVNLKKEKNQQETSHQKQLKEWKEKYSKQSRLLDEEQLECKKLEEKIEALEAQIQALKGGGK